MSHDGKSNGHETVKECKDHVMDCGVAAERGSSCMEAGGFEYEGLRVNRGCQEESTGHDQKERGKRECARELFVEAARVHEEVVQNGRMLAAMRERWIDMDMQVARARAEHGSGIR